MAFTADDIAALKRTLATGALEVRYADGRQVKYRSLDEMRGIIRQAEAETGGSSSANRSRSSVVGF